MHPNCKENRSSSSLQSLTGASLIRFGAAGSGGVFLCPLWLDSRAVLFEVILLANSFFISRNGPLHNLEVDEGFQEICNQVLAHLFFVNFRMV